MPTHPFLMLRHGVTDWNVKDLFQGRSDIALNTLGLLQAQEEAKKITSTPPDIVVSSPLLRAEKTGKIIATGIGRPLHMDDDLIECDFGSFEGQSIRDAMLAHKVSEKHELASILPEDAENWTLIAERALRCIERWQAHDPGSIILFVCHDAVMQAVAERLCGHWFDNRHFVPYRFELVGTSWSIVPYLSSE